MFIGLRSFNRKNLLENCLSSLADCENFSHSKVFIFDDHSKDFEVSWLKEKYSFATVSQWPEHIGSDESTRQVFIKFLESDQDQLFLLDSDLILRPDALVVANQLISQTDGVLSLYNSILHPCLPNSDAEVIQKKHLGDAGSLFSRRIVQRILQAFPSRTRSFDFKWSHYLETQGVRLFCVKDSLAQHLGLEGTNSKALYEFDYGLNFRPLSQKNETYLREFHEDFMKRHNEFALNREAVIDRLILPQLMTHFKRKVQRLIDRMSLQK